jgi:glycosyltransferase involved in cell wall biosynthesis
MRITLLVPGTGSFYCGSCLRDHGLATALRGIGHQVEVVPLYLPLYLEEPTGEERAEPVLMGGINMFLQQRLPGIGALRWATGFLDRPDLLRWAARHGDMTDPAAHAAMTLSMIRGEEGRQRREVARLVDGLAREGRPDVFVLSNAMLIGVARTLERQLRVPVVCTLQGEAPFLDSFPEPARGQAWAALAERARGVHAFVGVSRSYADLMTARMELDPERVHVVHNGIDPTDFASGPGASRPERPTVGYLARMCPDKGLDTLVEAFCRLHRGGRVPGVRLRAAGVLLEGDRPWFERLERQLADCGADHELYPNVERQQKLELLRSFSVLSVPATYGESFGLYLLEAMAAGVPVVQPRCDSFPELVAATGGGVLCEPGDPASLADELEQLLLDEPRRRALGGSGQAAVRDRFTAERMARGVERVCRLVLDD